MKKYFIKTVAVFILSAVFFMASGFCFHILLSPILKINFAEAASLSNEMAMSPDVCGNQQTNNLQISSHHNSISSCCSSEGHSIFNASSKYSEISKFIPAIFFSENQILKITPEIAIYNIPILPPPEISSIQTTILRI